MDSGDASSVDGNLDPVRPRFTISAYRLIPTKTRPEIEEVRLGTYRRFTGGGRRRRRNEVDGSAQAISLSVNDTQGERSSSRW